jgi:hypothetical protein
LEEIYKVRGSEERSGEEAATLCGGCSLHRNEVNVKTIIIKISKLKLALTNESTFATKVSDHYLVQLGAEGEREG